MDSLSTGNLLKFTGKVAVVTGGVAGIGFAICSRLGEVGALVFLADIADKRAAEAMQELQKAGIKAHYIHCDVSDEKEVANLVGMVIRETGKIDILVNNAGIYPRQTLTETTGEQFDNVISVNLRSMFLCSREVAKQMIAKGKGGCIINIASIDAIKPTATGLSAYDASKGGVLSLTRSMARELGTYDIRVNAIAPGAILTEGMQTQMSGQTGEGKTQLRNLLSRMALGRLGRPDDVARVVVFLASEMAGYMTGSVLVVDGGYLIS